MDVLSTAFMFHLRYYTYDLTPNRVLLNDVPRWTRGWRR